MDLVTYTLARGASSQQALYVEDVFSAWTYTGTVVSGTGAPQNINNGINLSLYGGMVWTKAAAGNYTGVITDSVIGTDYFLSSNTSSGTGLFSSISGSITFNSSGYVITGATGTSNVFNATGVQHQSWCFRTAAKFFDIVTYTGNGTSQTIPHNLNGNPGSIFVKRIDASGSWVCWHKDLLVGLPTGYFLLNESGGLSGNPSFTGFPWNATLPTTTGFSVGSLGSSGVPTGHFTNISGARYVAYVFADGSDNGFGETGTESIIKCGTYTASSGSTLVDMGFEPGFIFLKGITTTGATPPGESLIIDNTNNFGLRATYSVRLDSTTASVDVRDTYPLGSGISVTGGFSRIGIPGSKYVYIAIRKGFMRPPVDATKVHSQRLQAANGSATFINYGIKSDALFSSQRNNNAATNVTAVFSRQLGADGSTLGNLLRIPLTTGLLVTGAVLDYSSMSGLYVGISSAEGNFVQRTYEFVHYVFKEAANFFDQGYHPYAATGIRTLQHNLRATPELLILKSTALSGLSWYVYSALAGTDQYLALDTASGLTYLSGIWGGTTPTKTGFTVNTSVVITGATGALSNGIFYYAFASCPGVSKVGTYTGTSATLNVDCGFVNGARFLMVKRVESGTSGDWYVWDTSRGIVPSSDPYLRWNVTTGEISNTDFIDSYAPGFTVTDTASGTVNISGAVYLFLAVA